MEDILTAVDVEADLQVFYVHALNKGLSRASIHANVLHLSKFSCNKPLCVIADLKNRSQKE